MPPLDRSRFTATRPLEATVDRLSRCSPTIEMPQAARAALAVVATPTRLSARRDGRERCSTDSPGRGPCRACFVAAALQVHFARLAAGSTQRALVPVGDGVCPACGSAAGRLDGRRLAGRARRALSASARFAARNGTTSAIKCMLCASTKGIAYQEIEGGPGTVKAETCDACQRLREDPAAAQGPGVDTVADDVASLGLDMLMRETGFRRGGFNPFLLGY